VHVAVDAPELVTGFEHPGGERRAIVPPRQRLTFLACSQQISIIDSTGLVRCRVRARVGGTSRRRMVSVSVTTLRHYADPVSEVDRRAAVYLAQLTAGTMAQDDR
jgi:hypothetical protein